MSPQQQRESVAPDLVADFSDVILQRVRETARRIDERIRQATGDTVKLDAAEHGALPAEQPGDAAG